MNKKQLFRIDTILSEDVLSEDSLSLVTGGTGSSTCYWLETGCNPNCNQFTCTNYVATCTLAHL